MLTRRRLLKFSVGYKVFLKVSPMKGVVRTGKKNKLDPRYVGPFEILDKVEPVAYRLALPPKMKKNSQCISCLTAEEVCTRPQSYHILSAIAEPRRYVLCEKTNSNSRP